MSEKERRIYYQDIVYHVCNILDKYARRRVTCGTYNSPFTDVQDLVAKMYEENQKLKGQNQDLKSDNEFLMIVVGLDEERREK